MALQTPTIIKRSIVIKDVIDVPDSVGRNPVSDPGFETGDPWDRTGGWTVANGVAHNTGAIGTLSQVF